MSSERITSVIHQLTHDTVLGDLVSPVARALEYVRFKDGNFLAIDMKDFITLGVLRHVQGAGSLRELVQQLMHLNESVQAPVSRSTFSDALASKRRLKVVREIQSPLLKHAASVLPDRLAQFTQLAARPVLAIDGTYQHESAHYNRCTPSQGGDDNPKGHGLLSFYDVRLGCPCDVAIETANRHEMAVLRGYDEQEQALTRSKDALWLVDRAFIDAGYWDALKHKRKATMITRMKSNLLYEVVDDLQVDDSDINEGILTDRHITLNSSTKPWRLIQYRSANDKEVEFLTNEHDLEPGLIAFVYSRRWEEEKCFDTWKNDFSQAKAWGKSPVAIEIQTRLAIITSILIAVLIENKAGKFGIEDEKSLRKQLQRHNRISDTTDRPDWTIPMFRHITKLTRQVIRFLRFNLHKKSSHKLYKQQLWPMLLSYI